MSRNWMIFTTVLILSLLVRIYQLGGESVWVDEVYSLFFAKSGITQLTYSSYNDTHPPLYYLILHYWTLLFNNSEFSIRLPSLIFGVLSVFIIYPTTSIIFNRNTAIISSLVLGLSVFHIEYSQQARMYSLLGMLTLLSFLFFLKLLEREKAFFMTAYLITSMLLIYTHVSGLFVIISQNIYFFTHPFVSKKGHNLKLKKWCLVQAILLILFAPWLRMLLSQTMRVQNMPAFNNPTPNLFDLFWTFITYAGSLRLSIVFLALAGISLISYRRTAGNIEYRNLFKSLESFRWKIAFSNIDKTYLLLVWLLTPIILPFVVSQFSAPIYIIRATIPSSLAFYILVAKGIENIRTKYLKSIMITLVLGGSLIPIVRYYHNINNEQWRNVAEYVDSKAGKSDLLLFNTPEDGMIINCFNYYSQRTDLIKYPFPEKTVYVTEQNIDSLRPIMKGHNRIWLILCHSSDTKDLINKTLQESFTVSDYKEYYRIKVFFYERKSVKSPLIDKEKR